MSAFHKANPHWLRVAVLHNMVRPIAERCRDNGWAFQFTHYVILGVWPRR